MSEAHENLRRTVRELEEELHGLESVDEEARDVLREALGEITSALGESGSPDLEAETMTERLNQAAREFEGQHPTVSGIIRRLVDGLGQMGI